MNAKRVCCVCVKTNKTVHSELWAEIKGQKERLLLNERKHNDLEQHSSKQNLRVLGVTEPQGEEKKTAK